MQAIILAAGTGSRLGSDTPKSLIAITGKPLIVRLIEQFRRQGVGEIYVVTGHQEPQIREALIDYNVQTINNPFYQISDNMVSFWLGQLLVTETCLMAHGDLILADEIVDILVNTEGDVILPMDVSTLDSESMKIRLENSEITDISKDIPLPEATGESIPLMKFSTTALARLKELIAQRLEKRMLREYLEEPVLELTKSESLTVKVIDVTGSRWKEIDTPEDLASAIELFGAQ